MKASKIVSYIFISIVILGGLSWLGLPTYGERNVDIPAAPQPQLPPFYPLGYGYGCYDYSSGAPQQYQRAADQRIGAIEQELNAVNSDLVKLSDQTFKQDANVQELLAKLNNIEQTLVNISMRLKKVEEKVGIQAVGSRNAKNLTEPNGSNKPQTKAY